MNLLKNFILTKKTLNDYEKKEHEMMILTSELGQLIKPLTNSLSSYSVKVIQAIDDQGQTVADININILGSNEYIKDEIFKPLTIYHVLLRKSKQDNNQYYLMEIIEDDKYDENLSKYLKELQKPMVLKINNNTTVNLVRSIDSYVGNFKIEAGQINITLNTDNQSNNIENALKSLHTIIADIQEWESDIKQKACDEYFDMLVDNINNLSLTKKELLRELKLSELILTNTGGYIAFFKTKFLKGHDIVIEGKTLKTVDKYNIFG